MIYIDIHHVFPVPVEDAFNYITDIKNWPEYWPDFIRMQESGDIPWGRPGAKVAVVIKLLNRPTALNIVLDRFEKESLVIYNSKQKGLPEMRHERHFTHIEDGCEFRLRVEYEPRKGVKGLFDRYILKRSVENAILKTLKNQHSILVRNIQ